MNSSGLENPNGSFAMKSDDWNVTDEMVIEKTNKPLVHWKTVLTKLGVAEKKSSEAVAYLQWQPTRQCRRSFSLIPTEFPFHSSNQHWDG